MQDALIEANITELSSNGWKLMLVTSGLESNAVVQDGEGIFNNRMVFSKY